MSIISPFPESSNTVNQETIVAVILDASGSMATCYDDTIKGLNKFLDSQRNQPLKTKVSITTFNYSTKKLVEMVDIKYVPEITKDNYVVGGGTALLDAIGDTVRSIDAYSENCVVKPNVIICIITDGEENSSKKFSLANIKSMVKEKESKDWAFMFMGADIDAFSTGSSLGISLGKTLQYDKSMNTHDLYMVASDMVTNLRSVASTGASMSAVNFTDEHRSRVNVNATKNSIKS